MKRKIVYIFHCESQILSNITGEASAQPRCVGVGASRSIRSSLNRPWSFRARKHAREFEKTECPVEFQFLRTILTENRLNCTVLQITTYFVYISQSRQHQVAYNDLATFLVSYVPSEIMNGVQIRVSKKCCDSICLKFDRISSFAIDLHI